jgi:alkylated DNA repair dioxygenase AlkB
VALTLYYIWQIMTLSLFDTDITKNLNVSGIQYVPEFISEIEEVHLIKQIDEQIWMTDMKRRVQHYGYKYDYKARSVTADSYLGALPLWLETCANKLFAKGFFSAVPDQAIVNEYMPGQGISPHIDCVTCFGETIASLTLGSGAVMQFTKSEQQEIYLERRSLIVLSGEGRYQWQHAIPSRKSDIVSGVKIARGRRVSITFRNIIKAAI